MTDVACESNIHSVVRPSMNQWLRYWVAIGHTVVYHAWATYAFSGGIKCRHCRPLTKRIDLFQVLVASIGINLVAKSVLNLP